MIAFAMQCHNKTYISYVSNGGNNDQNTITHSFWTGRHSEEMAFIIAAGTVLVLFWTCYCYRKCLKGESDNNNESDNAIVEKSDNIIASDKYDELEGNEPCHSENENIVISTAMTSIQTNVN